MKDIEYVLNELSRAIADRASSILSKMIEKKISIEFIKTEVRKLEKLSQPIISQPIMSPEDMATGIYISLKGDIDGASLLIFSKECAFEMSDLLLKRNSGTTRRLSELDKSALKEVGNIISGSCFSILANRFRIRIVEDVPILSSDMFGAIIDNIITEVAQKADKAILINVLFSSESETIKGYFLLLFESSNLMLF